MTPVAASTDRCADLHTHTTFSDGVLAPGELVAEALRRGLVALAITDHDTVDGVAPAQQAAAGLPLEIVAGLEVSALLGGREVHVLGLFIDPAGEDLRRLCATQREARKERAEAMVRRAGALGLELTMEHVREVAGGAPIGRPHLAQALVEASVTANTQQGFDRYLGIGKPCFVTKRLPLASDAIAAIHRAGGAAVAAHPGSTRVHDSRLRELVEAGLDGAEVVHPKHGTQRRRIVMESCVRLGLLPSGGSDFHGPGRGTAELGQHNVPLRWVEDLRARARAHRHSQSG